MNGSDFKLTGFQELAVQIMRIWCFRWSVFSPITIRQNALLLLLQLQVICFASSFMKTLGQGGAGTCRNTGSLWHKPTAPCQNNEFLSTPHYHGRMRFYMQSEPEVCADSGGGGLSSPFTPLCWKCLYFCLGLCALKKRAWLSSTPRGLDEL